MINYEFDDVAGLIEIAIAEEREANGWISVKDRMPTQYVLLSVRLTDSGKHVIRRGCYIKKFDEETYDEDHFDYNEADETNYVPEGWYELIANWDNYTSVFINEGVVTHWMELPAAPKDEVNQ